MALEVAAAEKRVQELEKEQEKEVREEEKKKYKVTAFKEREEKRQKEKEEEAEKKIKEKAEKARLLREVTAGRKGEARGERREASSRGGGKRKLQAANKIVRQEKEFAEKPLDDLAARKAEIRGRAGRAGKLNDALVGVGKNDRSVGGARSLGAGGAGKGTSSTPEIREWNSCGRLCDAKFNLGLVG